MCGISGIFTKHITHEHESLLQAIIQDQTPRGPDFQDSICIKGKNNQILLGHNRLSIIDLTAHANQPMWDASKRYCIVYNGEIYNYLELKSELEAHGLIFKSNSDTEVILNAFAQWGIAALSRLHGPFALALYDSLTEKLWLCRDRFGVRPLFYTKINNSLYFASTTPALATYLSLKPDLNYIAQGLKYLVYEDGSEKTAYQNLFALPAGSYLEVEFNNRIELTTNINNYYNLTQNVDHLIDNLATTQSTYLLEQVRDKLENAVTMRLRTDVPLAISLSSGLDSSSIAALVSQQHKHTIGFSFGHPDQQITEGPLVAKCAKYLNIKMQYVWPSQTEMIEGLHKTIALQDAPFSTLSIVAQYLLYKSVRAAGVKVLLGGQGGDEAFMGYKKFLLFWLQQGIKQKRFVKTAKNLASLAPMLLAELPAVKSYWQHRHRYVKGKQQENKRILQLPASPALNLAQIDQPLWKRQLSDITQFSLPTLLRYEDRNGMGNSVESRLPFMDHQLIELGLALPESIKLRAGYGKWALRKIMENKIPNEIRLARYKRGFDIPVNTLLQAGFGHSIRATLNENITVANEFMQDKNSVNEHFSDSQLQHRKHAISEAISLLWLSKVLT